MKLNLALLETMREIRNYFIGDTVTGDFIILNNEIDIAVSIKKTMWIAIVGSDLNDGVFQVTDVYGYSLYKLGNGTDEKTLLVDETFTGKVHILRFPAGFMDLVKEIHVWRIDPANAVSNVVSEGEGVVKSDSWSVTRAVGKDGKPLTWQGIFAGRLHAFRKQFASGEVF